MSSTASSAGEVRAVGAGEGVAVAVAERPGPLLAELLGDGGAKVVGPRARRPGEARLDLREVVLGGCARLGVDDVVQSRQHRLRNAGRVVDTRPAEGLLQDLLDPLPVPRVEALPRQEDETRDEAAERVAADEEADAPALAEMEDPERDLEELVLRDLEQLVARIRLEDLDERLVVVAAAREPGPLDDVLRLAPEHRDLPRRRVVGGVRVEPEETALAGDLAARVEALDADVVEVGGPVHGRPRVRLRQVEQALRAREPPHLRRQLREAERDRPLVGGAEDAEPRAGRGAQHVLAVLDEHLVLAVAEEGEVVVVHPLEQVAGLGALVRVDGCLVELGDDLADALAHRRPVLDRGAHVLEHAAETRAQPLQLLRACLAVDLDVDQRLRRPVLGADLEQPSFLVAADAHDRPDHEVDRAPVPRHLHRDRVDEEGHVVDDRLDDGVRRVPAVLFGVRRVDVELQLAGPADERELPVRDRGAVEVEIAATAEVVRRDVRVVGAHEPLDVVGFGALVPLADTGDRRLEERLLPLIRARSHRPRQYGLGRDRR